MPVRDSDVRFRGGAFNGAFQQIADRLEGKPVQIVDATVDDNRTLHQFSDAELSAILRRRVGVVPVESEDDHPVAGALN